MKTALPLNITMAKRLAAKPAAPQACGGPCRKKPAAACDGPCRKKPAPACDGPYRKKPAACGKNIFKKKKPAACGQPLHTEICGRPGTSILQPGTSSGNPPLFPSIRHVNPDEAARLATERIERANEVRLHNRPGSRQWKRWALCPCYVCRAHRIIAEHQGVCQFE